MKNCLLKAEDHSDSLVFAMNMDVTDSADTIESDVQRDGQKLSRCLKWALVVSFLLALMLALIGLLYYFFHPPTSKLSAIPGNTQRRYRLGTKSVPDVYVGIVSRCRLKAVVMSE